MIRTKLVIEIQEELYEDIKDHGLCGYCSDREIISEAIKHGTPYEERPRGEWRDHSDEGYVECPFCEHATTCNDDIEELHFCFFCGASMVKKEGEADERISSLRRY